MQGVGVARRRARSGVQVPSFLLSHPYPLVVLPVKANSVTAERETDFSKGVSLAAAAATSVLDIGVRSSPACYQLQHLAAVHLRTLVSIEATAVTGFGRLNDREDEVRPSGCEFENGFRTYYGSPRQHSHEASPRELRGDEIHRLVRRFQML